MSLCSTWSTNADLPENCNTEAIAPQTLEDAHVDASRVLYDLTRRKYPGICTDTFTPFGSCRCAHGTDDHRGLELPAYPVTEIVSVVVDGTTLAASAYKLHDDRYLRRVGGLSWPCGYDLDDVDRFVVTYKHGRTPTPTLVRAAATLAWEFALARTPECADGCRLPQRVTSATRQGLSFAVIDPLTLFDDGRTGIPEVDMIVASHLRGETRRRSIVGVPGKGPIGTRF